MNGGDTTQPQGPSMLTRAKDWIFSIPLFTRTIFFICITLYIVQLIFNKPTSQDVCFMYYWITRDFQLWRLFSYTVFHIGILHILFNMMALMSLGWVLEVQLGTLHLTLTTIVLTFLASFIHMLIVLVFYDIIPWPAAAGYLNACGVGYSGILFSYMILSTNYGPVNQSLFGLYTVPSKFYPWIILVITVFLFPSSSFLGHLTGIFAGYIFVYAILNWRPYNRLVKWLEQKIIPSRVSALSCYYSSVVVNADDNPNLTGATDYRRPTTATDNEPDQLSELAEQREEQMGAIPKAIKKSWRWTRQKVQWIVDKIRGRVSGDAGDNPDYWAGRTDGRALGSV